ncbi:MAG TPA: response regulator transcription factor [Rickettsia endosymbiont of Bembidion lapponicum]|nr:response regulator transcription factor [Rickettsia endosymbiont of Bembidion lapponicum]
MLDKLLPQLLIIEEENKKSINISLCNDIERAGFNITRIINIEKILNYFFHEPLAIIVINAELQENPMVTVSNIRKIDKLSNTPIIFLSSTKQLNLMEIDDLISFFYKPFLSDQIIHFLKNLLRRSKTILQDNIIKFKNISIDLNAERVYKGKEIIRLGPTEFKILRLFLQSPDSVYSRREIMRYLWEDDESFNQRLIDVHINRIRDALGKDSPIIKTVRFIGYSLNKDIVESDT